MKKYLMYGFIGAVVVFFVALFYYLATYKQPVTIEDNVFKINDWNNPEYIENNMMVIHKGSVINIMEPEDTLKSEVIVRVESNDSVNNSYLVYLVDTVKYQLNDSIVEKKALNIGKYLYEETTDSVRTLLVYLTDEARELYK